MQYNVLSATFDCDCESFRDETNDLKVNKQLYFT